MPGTGLISKGTKISVKVDLAFVEIPDLQEVPDIGGVPDKVEVTTLADGSKRFIKGIVDYGDLEFKFLYDNSSATASYRVLRGLEDAEAIDDYQVELPDGTMFEFSAAASTKVDGAKVNGALTFSATLMLNSAIVVTDPVI